MSVIYGSLNGVSNFRLHGFGTGSYLKTCTICKKEFIGDKRAVQCLDCALEYERECECGGPCVEVAEMLYDYDYCPKCGGLMIKEGI